MALRIDHIRLSLDKEESALKEKVAAVLQIPVGEIQKIKIAKKSIDARRKNRIWFIYSLELSLSADLEARILRHPPRSLAVQSVPTPIRREFSSIKQKPSFRPVVVGTGPAGLFAALRLTASGLPPLILERGKKITERLVDVENFWRDGSFEPESNVQFGEGGAGTFSDGKLFTRLNDPRIAEILETFCRFGAPEEILMLQRPHIGTDRLRRIVQGIRQTLEGRGAEFKFQAKMTALNIYNGELSGLIVNGQEEVQATHLFLAIGHSSRDTYRMLYRIGMAMEAKPFAMGLRVEHPQSLIDRIQYGSSAEHPRLPPAEYQLTFRTIQGRGVYSFCMCPGGFIIAASSEKEGLVTNGMSLFHRNSPWANSALVVSVGPDDFGFEGPLAGMEFQHQWEKKAFHCGGGGFHAPAQGLLDFLQKREPSPLRKTSFQPGVCLARLDECLPGFIVDSLREALPHFNHKMIGFASKEAVLIGIETRTSSPIRLLRQRDFQSVSIRGLYPIGEGSGYSGGIVSSALDGLKAAETVLKKWE